MNYCFMRLKPAISTSAPRGMMGQGCVRVLIFLALPMYGQNPGAANATCND